MPETILYMRTQVFFGYLFLFLFALTFLVIAKLAEKGREMGLGDDEDDCFKKA